MSPLAEPAGLAASAEALRVAACLEDGEIVILAVKPSRWFVLMVTCPAILLAAAVLAGVCVLAGLVSWETNTRLVGLVCTTVVCTRLILACFQWQGRLYILTNRRVMRLRGGFREDLTQCRLRDILSVELSVSSPEHLLGLGSLLFGRTDRRPAGDIHWVLLADPKETQRLVCEAWNRAR